MQFNNAFKKVKQGQPIFGGIVGTNSPLVAEAIAFSGADYVLVDNQHGLWEPEAMISAFKYILAAGSTPFARVGENEFYHIGAMLDRGPLGIVVPMVHTAADAEAAVYATRFPPRGGRSMGPYGCRAFGADYLKWANDEIFLTVQIESQQGLDNVEAIMAVDGIDGTWVGPGDLSASIGAPIGSKAHDAAMVRIVEACKKYGKVPGTFSVGWTERRLEQGYLFVTPAADTRLLEDGMREMINKLKPLAK
jgi:4-hydroxy-2-oxoheptanedioate aldolase